MLFFVVLLTISSVGTPNAGNDDGKMSDGLILSLPHANNAPPSVQDKLYRKLLTAKRLLVVNLKHVKNELAWANGNDLDAGVLPELYVRSCAGSGNGSSSLSKVIGIETSESSSEDEQPIV